jgi:Transposase IS66 family
LLGDAFAGILTTDRWASYNWVSAERRQLCWSHLIRDFKSFLDDGAEAKRLGERLLAERRKLFRLWHRARDGTLTRAELQLATRPVRRRILALLEEGEGLSIAKVSGMCREMLKLRAAFFTFIDVERVDEQCRRAGHPVRRAHAQGLLRQRQRQGQSLHRAVLDSTPDAPHAEAGPLRVPQGRVCGCASWHADSVAATRASTR